MEPQALQAGARFAVLALVVLPLMPAGPFGPAPGIRPRELWVFVLLFSGLSFAGYIALRLLGPGRGHAVAGLLGGLVSSTVVTLNFARESRQQAGLGRALALGIIAACTVLYVRVTLLSSMLSPAVGLAVVRYFAVPLLAGVLVALVLMRRRDSEPADAPLPRNPLRLRPRSRWPSRSSSSCRSGMGGRRISRRGGWPSASCPTRRSSSPWPSLWAAAPSAV
jgi:uncharacterized membrane protein (DUF4010 family)